MINRILLFFSFLLMTVQICLSQEIVHNLSFELADAKGRLFGWDFGNTRQKYILKLDTAESYVGKCSFSIELPSDTIADRGLAGASSILVSSLLKFKKIIRVSAYMKTENLKDGAAGIGIRLNGPNGSSIQEVNSNNQSPTGTNDWKKVEIELPLTSEVQSISFAFHMGGAGKVWFDNFQLFIDEKMLTGKFND